LSTSSWQVGVGVVVLEVQAVGALEDLEQEQVFQ
jgi:hypothetical protein